MTREIRIDGPTAYVPLTQGLEAIIDSRDIELVEPYSWHAARVGRRTYARTAIVKDGRQIIIDMRQVLLGDTGGQRVYQLGEDLDYRRASLRVGPKATVLAPTKPRQREAKRAIRVDGPVAYVPLSRGYEATIDAEDVPVVAPYTWSALVVGGNAYAVTRINKETVYMRRMFTKPAAGTRVKSSGDTLDCRKASLGIAGALADVPQGRKGWAKPKGRTGRPLKRLPPGDEYANSVVVSH